MKRYTLEQRIEIVKIHYRNGENFAETVRKVRSSFGPDEAPSRPAIKKLINKFERLGQVNDVKLLTRAGSARSTKNIAAVAESVAKNPDLSISKRSLELGLSPTSLFRILHKDLHLQPFKLYATHEGVEESRTTTKLVNEITSKKVTECKNEKGECDKNGSLEDESD